MAEPPRRIERWLSRLLPRGPRGDAVLGDLREEYGRRARPGGEGEAARWYRREARALGVTYGRQRLGVWAGDLVRDLRFAMRRLRRSPGFVVVVVVVLALGIGANSATFAFVDALAFRPLPVSMPDRLVGLFARERSGALTGFSYPDWRDYREGGAGVFEGVAGFGDGPAALGAGGPGGGAVMVWTSVVTPGYFRVVRPRMQLGRALADDDVASVVLSDAFWRSRYGGDRDVIGRTLTLNGRAFEVVGVTARGFTGTRLFSYAPELWVPAAAHGSILPGSDGLLEARDDAWLHLVARLEPGVAMAEAGVAAGRITRDLAGAFPQSHGGRTIETHSNAQALNPWAFAPDRLRRVGIIALAGVSLVLLIACANVANMQLARSVAARRETAVRVSLGASRTRVLRGVLLESLFLALLGGGAGVALAWVLLHYAAGLEPQLDYATAFEARIDWRVTVFTLMVAAAAAVLAGVLPILRQRRVDPATTLRGSGAAGRTSRLHDGLVVAQMAFSMVVLVAGGLLVRSLRNARAIDPGFPLSGGVVVTIDPVLQGYSPARADEYYDRLLDRLRVLPAVTGATRANHLPLDGSAASRRVTAEGRSTSPDEWLTPLFYAVEPGFFATLGTPLLDGRALRSSDDSAADPVAIINQTLAERLWPGETPVGRRLRVDDRVATVVGLVADAKYMFLNERPQPMLAMSIRQTDVRGGAFLVRTAGDPGAAIPVVREAATRLDPQIALVGLKTLRDNASYTLSAAFSGAWGATIFGLLALLLTAAGLYGVVAHAVARRIREIGIRMALGAHVHTVTAMVVHRGMRLALLGLAIGAALAIAAGRLLAGLLYGIRPLDAATFLAVAALLAIVALFASWAPSRRAASVDPITILRSD